LPLSFLDLNPANDFSSEYVSGPLEFKIRKMSIRLGLAITEKIILTRFDVDCRMPPLFFGSMDPVATSTLMLMARDQE
jgi:hypothetical protein